MERVRFERKVYTVIRLTRQEIEILSEACERHYDHAVRELSEPGIGAILNGARNELNDFGGKDKKDWAEIEVDNHQLGLLQKATEAIHSAYSSMPGSDMRFTMWFGALARDASAEYLHVNPGALERNNEHLRVPMEMPGRPPEVRKKLGVFKDE